MSHHNLKTDSIIAGKYRVVRQLGRGGMGTVYLVKHAKTDEKLAMKLLNPSVIESEEARERFRREARTPALIDSDHVARVVDSDIAEALGDVPFIVMEYLKGRDLQVLSNEVGALPAKEVVTYLRQAAIALDKAHGLGIVHRDLKPENLFLTKRDDGTPCIKLLDFGVAKLSGAAADIARQRATATGVIFGTPLYMSPEQCKSEADRISPQTDLWALGLITYRLLQGEDFWNADTLTHLIAQIAYEPMPAPSERGSELGERFDKWFARCCAREVEERFKSAGEAVEELERALGLAPHAEPSGMYIGMEAAGDAFEFTNPGRARPSKSPRSPLKQTSGALARDTLPEEEIPGLPRRGKPWLWVALVALLGAGGAGLLFSGVLDRGPTMAASPDDSAQQAAPPASATVAAAKAAATSEPVATAAAAETPTASATTSADASANASAAASASAQPPVIQRPWRPPTGTAVQPPAPRPPVPRPPPPVVDPLSGRH